jgi:threonine dehydratase
MKRALDEGQIEELPYISTIADGIAVKKAGNLTYELCKKYVDEIVTVTDDEISAAILALMEKHKLVTEGAGATAVAGVMFGKLNLKGKKVVCLLSGGNIDVTILSRIIHRGLIKSGRSCVLSVEILDRPGQLFSVTKIIADHGGNVMSVSHDRENEQAAINSCYVQVVLETRNFEHIEEIKKALSENGFRLL